MNLADKIDSDAHRVLVFGGPKSGKSWLVGQLASHFNLLWFDLENGYKVLRKLPIEQQQKIDIISIPDTRSYPIAIETVLKVTKKSTTPLSICHAHGKVDCQLCKKSGAGSTQVLLDDSVLPPKEWIVVFDSLTQLANSAMAHITRNQPDDYKYEWDDYRKQGGLMDKVLTELQVANYNIVAITHEIEAELEDKRKKIVPVAGTTNFSRNTAKYFDHVIYCDIKNKGHYFGSGTTYANSILTGSRTDVKLEDMAEASLLAIFKPEAVTPEMRAKVKEDVKNKEEQNSDAAKALLARIQEAKAKQG